MGFKQCCTTAMLQSSKINSRKLAKASLKLRLLPNLWKEAKVVFISKVSKIGYSTKKYYRCISISSFLLKPMERLLSDFKSSI